MAASRAVHILDRATWLATVALLAACTMEWDRVQLTENPDVVRNCQRIGSVEPSKSDQVSAALFVAGGTKAIDWTPTLKRLAYERGADTLFVHGNNISGEAYLCAGAPVRAQVVQPLPTNTPVPTIVAPPPTRTPANTKVKIVGKEDDVRGCVFVDSIDQEIECPVDYPAGVPCMAFRANLQGGNTVLARGGGKVYNCPRTP